MTLLRLAVLTFSCAYLARAAREALGLPDLLTFFWSLL
jgi:hypothetical protein